MTPDVMTPARKMVRSHAPLKFEVEAESYMHPAPSIRWHGDEGLIVSRGVYGYWSATELREPPLQLQPFIRGMQLHLGASASWQPGQVIGIVVGQTDAGDLTFTELDADDVPVGDRMRNIAGAQELVESRLTTLSELSAGWLDGDGVTPSPDALAAARRLIWLLLIHGVERPRLAPTPEGGVEAEWTVGSREVSVTFEPDGSLYGNAVDVTSGEISEPLLDPDDPRAVAEFVVGA